MGAGDDDRFAAGRRLADAIELRAAELPAFNYDVSRQARRTFSPSSGTVSSHEQIRMFRGPSAISLVNLFVCPANSRQLQQDTYLHIVPYGRGSGLGTFRRYNYRYSKLKGRVRNNAA